jgi:hypothetical protein
MEDNMPEREIDHTLTRMLTSVDDRDLLYHSSVVEHEEPLRMTIAKTL